jgi:hypothetical protein
MHTYTGGVLLHTNHTVFTLFKIVMKFTYKHTSIYIKSVTTHFNKYLIQINML